MIIFRRIHKTVESVCLHGFHWMGFCEILFYFFENHAVYEIMWKNIVEIGRSHMTIWRMRNACWIHKATKTYLDFAVLFTFPLQQCLHECTWMLHYTYIACLVTDCSNTWQILKSRHQLKNLITPISHRVSWLTSSFHKFSERNKFHYPCS